jgi:short-subunit dehydrogenase
MTARYAMVTGASSGIGASFCALLAQAGWAVVLVGRDADRLDAARRRLTASPHETLVVDLATPHGCLLATERLKAKPQIELLVNCAGAGTRAAFPGVSVDDEESMLAINVTATLRLSHAACQAMADTGGGAIVNIASTAGVWSGGTYAASKAWVLSFSEGLSQASTATGVHCLVVVPGFTRTDFQRRAGRDASAVRPWLWLDPEYVAQASLAALAEGKTRYTPGRRYRVLVYCIRRMPSGLRHRVVTKLGSDYRTGRRALALKPRRRGARSGPH